MKKLIPLLTLFTAMLSVPTAHAACSTPTADAGSMVYNTTQNALQFCNGTDWYNTGLVVPTATGTSCTNPAGPEGSAFYNTTQNTIQFCNGDDWVNMGTMKFPSATGTACTVPTGPEGSMFFNTTTSTMQFCNGDDWVNATYLTIAADVIDGIEMNKIQATDKQGGDRFGESVSINGDYAIVGALYEDVGGFGNSGSAYIFKRSGTSWAQQAKISASDPQDNDLFGKSVSISGDYAIVGAYYEDTGGTDIGAVYIFKRTGTSWAQEAKIQSSDKQANDWFGEAVSIDGDYAIIGARGRDGGGGPDAGIAYIFKRSGTSWTEEAKIQASVVKINATFGHAVSINGDYAIVGAEREIEAGINSGVAYIFKRTGTSWAQEAQIQSSDAQAGDGFGWSVSVSGDYAVIGANREDTGGSNSGAAYIFKRTGTNWAQEAKIVASDARAHDYFGHSVSISGDYIAIGAYNKNTNGVNGGAAYIFKRTGSTWNEISKVQGSDAEAGDQFGTSVAISNGYAIVGAPFEATGGSQTGAAYIFD